MLFGIVRFSSGEWSFLRGCCFGILVSLEKEDC